MNITISTIDGTYVVPAEKQSELIMWLQQHAIKVGQETVREQTSHQRSGYTGRQLINENR